MRKNQEKKSGSGFLTFLGVILLLAIIIGGTVFIVKCTNKKYFDSDANSDGNPILLNRAATVNDFEFEQSFEATLTNLKDSYILIPKSDIKNLKLTLKYYDSSNNLVCTHTSEVGDATKNHSYTVSVSHTLTDLFKIAKYQYTVSGGTVSYFS
ncbi:MAG: hypothetical protein NC311_16035 [Muribaculaceae bacterium]|nr:hypothetical protein [Muribaculaceae bacterium]